MKDIYKEIESIIEDQKKVISKNSLNYWNIIQAIDFLFKKDIFNIPNVWQYGISNNNPDSKPSKEIITSIKAIAGFCIILCEKYEVSE